MYITQHLVLAGVAGYLIRGLLACYHERKRRKEAGQKLPLSDMIVILGGGGPKPDK
jgi:hypothetical protein